MKNYVVALDGTILFGGGDRSYLRTVLLQEGANIPLWHSEDGGERGTLPEEFVMWRSRDHGQTWTKEEIDLKYSPLTGK